jgi:hypothetical protein
MSFRSTARCWKIASTPMRRSASAPHAASGLPLWSVSSKALTPVAVSSQTPSQCINTKEQLRKTTLMLSRESCKQGGWE